MNSTCIRDDTKNFEEERGTVWEIRCQKEQPAKAIFRADELQWPRILLSSFTSSHPHLWAEELRPFLSHWYPFQIGRYLVCFCGSHPAIISKNAKHGTTSHPAFCDGVSQKEDHIRQRKSEIQMVMILRFFSFLPSSWTRELTQNSYYLELVANEGEESGWVCFSFGDASFHHELLFQDRVRRIVSSSPLYWCIVDLKNHIFNPNDTLAS